MTAKWSRWRYLEARFVTILTIRFKGALVPAWPADRSPTRTGPVEADGAVDAQNAPTAPWKTLLVFHELPQGFPHPITHDKPRKSPESYWETRIDPLNAPDYTTLSRRNRDVLVPALRRDADGPIHVIVDSTGLKIYGADEWCSRKHRKANERGGWRKLHIGVADDGYVVAVALTQNTVDDADMLPDLLGQIDAPLRRFTGDGAYDTHSVYQAVGEAGGPGVAEGYGALGAEEPAYRADCRDRKTGVAEGNRLPAAGPGRGHVPPVQTDPRRQSPCEGVRGAEARSDGGVHGAEQDVSAREGGVLRGRGVTVGDFDTGSGSVAEPCNNALLRA